MKKVIAILLLSIAGLFGQAANPQTIIVDAPVPPSVNPVNLNVVGPLGQSTYYYYVVANYPIGKIISNPFVVRNAPLTLSNTNYITVSWNPLPGATSYDIVQVNNQNVFNGGSGTCTTCLIASAITITSYNAQTNPSGSYSLAPIQPSSVSFFLNNRDQATPYFILDKVSGPLPTFDIKIPVICELGMCSGFTPGGPAGGVLSGTYPNPGFNAPVATAALNDCSGLLKGLVPTPPNNTTQYLRADCTFGTPAGSGTTPGGNNTDVQFNNMGAFGGDDSFNFIGTTVYDGNPFNSFNSLTQEFFGDSGNPTNGRFVGANNSTSGTAFEGILGVAESGDSASEPTGGYFVASAININSPTTEVFAIQGIALAQTAMGDTLGSIQGISVYVDVEGNGIANSVRGVNISSLDCEATCPNIIGLRVADQTAGVSNHSILTGLGLAEFGDIVRIDSLSASLPIFTDSSKNLISGTLHGNTTRVQTSDNTGTSGNLAKFDANGNVTDGGIPAASTTQTIAAGTSTMATAGISSGACATVVTTTATGVATTDSIIANVNGNPTAVTGYAPSANGSLYLWAWPTTNNVNFAVCNDTSSTITPGAITLNWKVVR